MVQPFVYELPAFGQFFLYLGGVVPVNVCEYAGGEPVVLWGGEVDEVGDGSHEADGEGVVGEFWFLDVGPGGLELRGILFFIFL